MGVTMGLFMILFGCSDDLTACERIEAAPTTYVSAADCRARQANMLLSPAATSADYPTIVARCLSAAQVAAIGSAPVDLNDPVI